MPNDSPKLRKTRHFDSPQQEAFLNLWRTYDRLHAAEEELFGRHDLTPQQYNVLRLLRGEHPGRVPTLTLASRLVSRAPDITRMLDKLDARKLIVRERPETNRRQVLIGITDEGLALLASLDEDVRACHAHQLGHMPTDELKALTQLLKQARAPHESEESSWR
jgi:DNA-binding MarR family transcriptional regulator